MKSEPIVELISTNPGIRTVEISDQLDCDIEPLQLALSALIQSGVIIGKDVIGPNQRNARAFWLTGHSSVVEKNVPTQEEPKASEPSEAPISKVAQAIRFVAANGTVTSTELHRLLGLKSHEYASSYLSCAIKDGRLVKEGKNWSLGSGTRPEPDVTIPVFTKGPFAKVAQRSQEPAAAASIEVHAHLAKPTQEQTSAPIDTSVEASPTTVSSAMPAPAVIHAPEFSCALWSHGELQLVRGGAEIAKLTPAESRQLLEYLGRIIEDAEVMP